MKGCAILAVLLASFASAAEGPERPPATVHVIGATPCDGAPCLQVVVRVRSSDGVRFLLGGDAVPAIRSRFGANAGLVLDALLKPLGKAMAKRRLRPATERVVSALASAGAVKFYAQESHVALDGPAGAQVARIAERYFRATGGTLFITSGRRTAAEQADAMYVKVRSGGSLGIYKDREAIKAIRAAAKQARREKKDRVGVVAAMAAVIKEQMQRGVYISQHLLAGAVDIRSSGMSAAQRRAFRRAALSEPGVSVLTERRPPHFHLSLR